MAKTKRRQLAALAAQAELKELVGHHEKSSSEIKSAPSGTIPQAGDPMVEIRTQRVIFKIPALPPKPPAADPDVAKNANLGKRRKKTPQMDIEPSSEQIPADEAKISKGILQIGKWKRHKKIRDLLPTEDKSVPSSAGLSNGGHVTPVAKSMGTDKQQNGELHPSVGGFQNPSKKRVKLVTGSQKRAKLQEVFVRSPSEMEKRLMTIQGAKLQDVILRSSSEKESVLKMKTQGEKLLEVVVRSPTEESTLMKTLGEKVQEVVIRPPAEKESKSMTSQGAKLQEVFRTPAEMERKMLKTVGNLEEMKENTRDRSATLATTKRRSRDLVAKDADRSEEFARAPSGDLPRTSAPPPVSYRRRRANVKKVISQVPVIPESTGVSHHRTRARSKISYSETMALEVLSDIQSVKNISHHTKKPGKVVEMDTLLKTSTGGVEEAIDTTTRDQAEADLQRPGNSTGSFQQGKEKLALVGVTPDSSSHEQVPSGPHTSYHSCSQGDPPGYMKSQLRIEELHGPVASGKRGQGLAALTLKKDLGISKAEIIKRDSQLKIMQRRLDEAGGLRKWLLDKGLGQVLPLLDKWNIDTLSLMQLTMEGLKSMGLLPVGPRRKLIHAICSLTLPSFSKAPLRNAHPR